jgi:hypothetical protein
MDALLPKWRFSHTKPAPEPNATANATTNANPFTIAQSFTTML